MNSKQIGAKWDFVLRFLNFHLIKFSFGYPCPWVIIKLKTNWTIVAFLHFMFQTQQRLIPTYLVFTIIFKISILVSNNLVSGRLCKNWKLFSASLLVFRIGFIQNRSEKRTSLCICLKALQRSPNTLFSLQAAFNQNIFTRIFVNICVHIFVYF